MRDPAADLRRIAYLLERSREPTYRVKAFRTAAERVDFLGAAEVAARAQAGTLQELPGIGKATAAVIADSVAGREPEYLRKTEQAAPELSAGAGAAVRAALRGDLHMHSDWSDGGSPILEMALAARELGHDYAVLTDHSPRLTVANGLSPDRLREQLDIVAGLNVELAPFRLLTGIEVDILDDGSLDQSDELLERLDIVVASVHSKLRMPAEQMTPRMVAAIANPHTDVLGHCTGRLVGGKRPESEFDAEIVFEACAGFGVAVEVNSRPERQDPPERLLSLALEMQCLLSVDTDAHAPGQLGWQVYGCDRLADCAGTAEIGVDAVVRAVVNTWPVEDLLAWAGDHDHRPAAGTPPVPITPTLRTPPW